MKIQQLLLTSVLVAIVKAQSKDVDCNDKSILFKIFCQIEQTKSLITQNETEVQTQTDKSFDGETNTLHFGELKVGRNEVEKCVVGKGCSKGDFTLSNFKYSLDAVYFEVNFNATFGQGLRPSILVNYSDPEGFNHVTKTIEDCLILNCLNVTFQIPKYFGYKTTCYEEGCQAVQLIKEDIQKLRDVARSLWLEENKFQGWNLGSETKPKSGRNSRKRSWQTSRSKFVLIF